MVTCCNMCYLSDNLKYCVYIIKGKYERGTICDECYQNVSTIGKIYSDEIIKKEELTIFEKEFLPENILEFQRIMFKPTSLIFCICEIFIF